LIATRVMVTSASPVLVTVAHWPGPTFPTGWVGKVGVSVDNRGPTACCTIVPGEPVWSWAKKAPLTPRLSFEITGSGGVKLPNPAALSKEKLVVAVPNLTPVRWLPAALKTLTASPPLLRPTPEPLRLLRRSDPPRRQLRLRALLRRRIQRPISTRLICR
jgi:hypothetical protein